MTATPMSSTAQRYLDQLRAFWQRTGRVPTAAECGAGLNPNRNPELPAYSSLTKYFGTFGNALRAAGLTPRRRGERIHRRGGDRFRAANREKWLRRPRKHPRKRGALIFDPHWPVILHDAKQQFERWEAA